MVEGDCVVPCRSALLPGTRSVMLDGVFHSMSRVGGYGEEAVVPWYGSGRVLDAWLGIVVEEWAALSAPHPRGAADGEASTGG